MKINKIQESLLKRVPKGFTYPYDRLEFLEPEIVDGIVKQKFKPIDPVDDNYDFLNEVVLSITSDGIIDFVNSQGKSWGLSNRNFYKFKDNGYTSKFIRDSYWHARSSYEIEVFVKLRNGE